MVVVVVVVVVVVGCVVSRLGLMLAMIEISGKRLDVGGEVGGIPGEKRKEGRRGTLAWLSNGDTG